VEISGATYHQRRNGSSVRFGHRPRRATVLVNSSPLEYGVGHINPTINQTDFPDLRDGPGLLVSGESGRSGLRECASLLVGTWSGCAGLWDRGALLVRSEVEPTGWRRARRTAAGVNMVVVKTRRRGQRAQLLQRTQSIHARWHAQDYDLRIETIQYPCPQDRKTGSLRRIDSGLLRRDSQDLAADNGGSIAICLQHRSIVANEVTDL
jgi:hypothetical protein